ncbi:ribbon-helix-helix protein, CopG family [Bradyrhizobium sp.]|uniref:ribbon-helix-helix protein, CopG family n=1 Tax=Bradyrhizobium sp. TaxID=376 RepID=UPI0027322398|nr:ribbon-helix-helix protein, CopG family [Bradyrhizobium sp.]
MNVGDRQLRELDELSKQEKRSRAALIREAIDDFLAKRRRKHESDAFGLWGTRKADGLVYQNRLRNEW